VRDQDRAHDSVALQRDMGRIRHELTRISFEEPGHVAPPLVFRTRVDAVLLLHVPFVHVHQELREAEDFVLLRRLQLHPGGRGVLLRRCLHPHPRKHPPKTEGVERRLIEILEVGGDRGRSSGSKPVHAFQERRRGLGAIRWIHGEPRNLGGAQSHRADDLAVFLDREVRPLLLRREREVAIEVDLEFAGRKIRAPGDEGPPVCVGVRRL